MTKKTTCDNIITIFGKIAKQRTGQSLFVYISWTILTLVDGQLIRYYENNADLAEAFKSCQIEFHRMDRPFVVDLAASDHTRYAGVSVKLAVSR